MAYNGSGTFLINTAGQPVVPNTVISATAFNALTNDLANGLSTCITKDGQTTPTANIPMGNNKITGLAPGTSGTDAANLSQVQGSTAKLLQSVTGTDTITAAMVPALTSYSAGQMFYFVAAGDNTGAVTINIDSLGAKSVTRDGSTALVAGDIVSGEVALIVYDGTRFQLLNGNSFTNLNVSNNLTLSGGTANGVLYLNGSKVATSGSALVFDGTNLGIGTASTTPIIGTRTVQIQSSGGATCYVTTGTHNAYMSVDTSGGASFATSTGSTTLGLGVANGNAILIDANRNVGIGTASPGSKLDVAGGIRATTFATNTFAINANPLTGSSTAAQQLRFQTTGADFYVGTESSVGGSFFPGSTAYAGVLFNAASTPMQFYTAGTLRATLTAGGDFAIGAAAASGSNERLYVTNAQNLVARFKGTSGGLASIDLLNDANKVLGLAIYASTYSGGSSFNVGANGAILGSTTGSVFCVGTYDAQPLLLGTNSTERGRFTAGGEFLLSGLTSSVGSYWLQIKNTGSSANGAYMENASGNDRSILVMKHDQAAGATTGAMVVFQNSSGSTVGSITSSNTATAYNISSDRRLKLNIAAADEAGSVIDAIEIVKHDWKVGGHTRYGVVAQDLHAVAPEAVSVGDDGEEIEKTWGVDYSKLVPMLVKEIQSLRSRVSALEAK